PGVTYALPLGERLAVGLGVGYQHRTPFRPRAGLDDDYDPGDELLLTGGLDYRLSPATALSLDLTYAAIGTDTSGDLAYASGDAVAVTARLRSAWRRHDVHLLGRFRSKGGGDRATLADAGFGA